MRQITDEQMIHALCTALVDYNDRKPIPEALLHMAVKWADHTRMEYALFELVLDGELLMKWDSENEDWVFKKNDRSTRPGD